MLIQIDTPHFCAGIELQQDGDPVKELNLICVDCAPIVKYMKGWRLHKINNYVKSKHWKLTVIE